MIEKIPWRALQQFHRRIRRKYFTTPRPSNVQYFRIDGRDLSEGSDGAHERVLDHLTEALGERSYAPNWEFSYRYRGEDLNLARVVYEDSEEHSDVLWWQNHVRAWPVEGEPGMLDVRSHWEPEPTEHPTPHLEGVGFSGPKGMEMLREHLDEAGIEYTETAWKKDG